MSLGGLVQAHHHSDEDDEMITTSSSISDKIPKDHEGHVQLPKDMPKGVQRPYTQVVTTIVKNGILQPTHFGFDKNINIATPVSIIIILNFFLVLF